MAGYLYIGSYTAEGARGLMKEGAAAREAETRTLFGKVGGEVLAYSFAVGEADFAIWAEMPDDMAALVPPLLASTTGTVNVHAIKLVSTAEMDGVIGAARSASFRGAGH